METKEELRKQISDLKRLLADKESEIKRLKDEGKENLAAHERVVEELREEFGYISWLNANYKHLSRFLKECLEINIEEEYDYYGNFCCSNGSITVLDPYRLTDIEGEAR